MPISTILNQHPDSWDFLAWFNIFIKFWERLFSREHCNNSPKSYLFLIKHYRNQWAHNYSFTLRDAYRVVDTIQLFFEEIKAPTDEINMLRLIILDALFTDEKERYERGEEKPTIVRFIYYEFEKLTIKIAE